MQLARILSILFIMSIQSLKLFIALFSLFSISPPMAQVYCMLRSGVLASGI